MIKKPLSIAANEFKSNKWDEITNGRNFAPSDSPVLELLCQWYAIAERCMDDMDSGDGVQVAYTNDVSDIKALPHISVLKQASAEIRALNKQLGIDDEPKDKPQKQEETTLYVIQGSREKRSAKAANTA